MDSARIQLTLPRDFPSSEAKLLITRFAAYFDVAPPRHIIRKSAGPIAGPEILQVLGSLAVWAPLSLAATKFLWAFAETLGKRAAEGLADSVAELLRRSEVKPL